MDLFDLKTDESKEEAGVKVKFGDATVTLRSRQSEFYRKTLRDLFKPHEASIALNLLPEKTQRDLIDQATAKGLIVTWDGFNKGGEPFPYTFENAMEALKVKAFRLFIEEQADKIDNFREAKEQAEVKNS